MLDLVFIIILKMEKAVTKTYFNLLDGFFGGILAGVVMGLFGMLQALLAGQGIMLPLILIGFSFQPYNDSPEINGGLAIIGLLIHMAMSMIVGIVFVFFANLIHAQKRILWIWGALYASFIWLFLQFGLLRLLNPIMAEQINQKVFLLAHIIFGIVLGLYVSWQTDTNDVNKM